MGRRAQERHRRMYEGVFGRAARIWDAAIGTIAPGTALEMRKARMRSASLLSYEAARHGRTAPAGESGSADAELLPDLYRIRARSRAMVRDDAHAAAAVRVLGENVIGEGLVPQSVCTPEKTGLAQEECDDWNRQCEDWFGEWCERSADATRHGTFFDLQAIVARSLMADGEALAHAANKDGVLVCELIDPDRLESPNMVDTDRIRAGVEMDAFGEAIAYHVLEKHPADAVFGAAGSTKANRWKARDRDYSLVQHVFRRERPGQTRGVPWLAAALGYQNHLHHYLDSELIAARANSNVALIVKRPPSQLDQDLHAGSGGDDEHFLESLRPGAIEYLADGEDVEPFMPNRPGTAFEPFVQRILRAIWASQGMAYELVAKDFGSMNYSSARALLLECRRGFDSTRSLVIRQFCRPWWSNVIRNGIALGRLPAPRRFMETPAVFLASRWIAPSYGWVDPVKEIDASRQAIEANLSTPYAEASRAGQDAEQVLRDRARFLQLAAKIEAEHGLEKGALAGAKPATAAAPGGDQVAPEPDEEDEDQGGDEPEPDEEQEDQEP